MKKLLVLLAVVLLANSVQAQCGETKVFVTNMGFQNSSVVINSNHSRNSAVVIRQTGHADVTAVDGVVIVPAQINSHGHHTNSTVVVPQSTFFFAARNPNVLEFRTREFFQVPKTSQIVTIDGFGNNIVLNAGIRNGSVGLSRGQQLFSR